MQPTAEDLQQLVLDGASQPNTEQAQQALDMAGAYVQAYVRGQGQNRIGEWRDGVGEVVMSVAARILANPSFIGWRNQAGNFSMHRSEGFTGFTLAEQFVLNRYRKTAM